MLAWVTRGASVVLAVAASGCMTPPPPPPLDGRDPPSMADGVHHCEWWEIRWSVDACVGPLTAEQASRRGRYARIRVQGGQPTRVEFFVGAGGYAPWRGDLIGFDVVWHGDRTTRTWFDRWDRPVVKWETEGRVTRHLAVGGGPARAHPDDAFATVTMEDAQGFPAIVTNIDEAGRPATVGDVHETRFARDQAGRVLDVAHFGRDRLPATNEAGVHRQRFRHDARGCQIEWQSFDTSGAPFGGYAGPTRGVSTCDAHGNAVSERWFGADGEPVLNVDGHKGWNAELDDHGAQKVHTAIGMDGRAVSTKGRDAITRYEHDARGYVVKTTWFNASGKPSLRGGIAGEALTVLENGAVVKKTHVDASGRPASNTDGHAEERREYDDNGLLVAVRYFDADGRPAQGPIGGAAVTYENDARGRWVTMVFRDRAGRPVDNAGGFATQEVSRNPESFITSIRHLDAKGRPIRVPLARLLVMSHMNSTEPKPALITRDEARRRAEAAMKLLQRNGRWRSAAAQFGDDETTPRWFIDKTRDPQLYEAAMKLLPGAPPAMVETPEGFVIVERMYDGTW